MIDTMPFITRYGSMALLTAQLYSKEYPNKPFYVNYASEGWFCVDEIQQPHKDRFSNETCIHVFKNGEKTL